MAAYDIIFIHPPSFYDFRKRVWFPGPIDRTVPNYTAVFMMFPVGLISIGSYLQDHGLKIKIINLAEKMVSEKGFEIEHYLQGFDARIIGVDLHWAVHSHGSIKIAQICKSLHPESLVILGGLTATCFADEIVANYPFIDCVVRGEAEEPLLRLMNNIHKPNSFQSTPNLTYYEKNEGVTRTDDLHVAENLDSLDFTRLEIVEPNIRTLTSPTSQAKLWNIPICRGCTLNCATCGGSKYSYQKLMNRQAPAFRSPRKLVEDFQRLDEQGISSIFLFQDPRIGGEKYARQVIDALKGSQWSHITNVGIELFYPADRSFIKYLSENRPADHVGLSISPESAEESVRRAHGREYANEELLLNCQYCRELDIPFGVFFMTGLGYETHGTLEEMWDIWKEISLIEKKVKGRSRIFTDFGPMIFLDPGSLAFDYPEKYGYRLKSKSFKDYCQAMEAPHWSQWISYETVNMSRHELADAILRCSDEFLKITRELGRITEKEYQRQRLSLELDRIFISEFEEIMKIENPAVRDEKIRELAMISKDPLLSHSYVLTQTK